MIKFRKENIYLVSQILSSYLITFEQKIIQFFGKEIKFIHIIGDSHVFSFLDKKIQIHYLGSVTAHNLIRNDSISKGRRKFFKKLSSISHKELLVIMFGEIDCRLHIYYQYMKHNRKMPLKYYILRTARNYTKFIKEVRKQHPNIAVISIFPTGEQSNIYNFSYYADKDTRVKITKDLNKQIKMWCLKLNVPYINLYTRVADRMGNRKTEYILDSTHFNRLLVKLLLDNIQKNPVLRKFLV